MTLLRHGVFFALGILLWTMQQKRITLAGIVGLGAGLLLAGVEIAARARELAPAIARSAGSPTPNVAGLALASCAAFYIAFLAIVLSVLFNHKLVLGKRMLDSLRVLGLTTYPFYLLHETIGGAALTLAIAAGLPFLAALGLALVTVGIVAVLVASALEPALRNRLRPFFVPKTASALTAVETV